MQRAVAGKLSGSRSRAAKDEEDYIWPHCPQFSLSARPQHLQGTYHLHQCHF